MREVVVGWQVLAYSSVNVWFVAHCANYCAMLARSWMPLHRGISKGWITTTTTTTTPTTISLYTSLFLKPIRLEVRLALVVVVGHGVLAGTIKPVAAEN